MILTGMEKVPYDLILIELIMMSDELLCDSMIDDLVIYPNFKKILTALSPEIFANSPIQITTSPTKNWFSTVSWLLPKDFSTSSQD